MIRTLALTLFATLAPSLALAQQAPVATTPAPPPTAPAPTQLTSPAPTQLTSPAELSPAATPSTAATTPAPPRAREPAPPFASWPVRVHLSMPLGSTFGHDHLQGFTWGFRGTLQVYPTPGFRWVGIGGFAEMLLDAETRQYTTFGGVLSGPVASWSWGDLRAAGTAGARYRGDADPRGAALELGAQIELVLPAYLYDLSLGLRVDTMIDETGLVATSLMVDVDLAVLVLMLGAAGIR